MNFKARQSTEYFISAVILLLFACTPLPSDPLSSTPVPPTSSAVIKPKPNLSFADALFVVMSGDRTQLLAAYEEQSELQVLHQLSASTKSQAYSSLPFPSISQDGVWVTVLEDEELFSQCIYRAMLDSPNEPQCILTWPGFQMEATISMDGKRIAFQAAEKDCEVYRKTGEYYGCQRQIYVMNSDGSNVRRITDMPGDRCSLKWSPNNIQLAYTEMCAPTDEGLRKAYVVTLESYNLPKKITQVTAKGMSNGWLPNGEWLEWQNGDGPQAEHRLSQIDAEGKIVDETSLDHDGVWSPDSNKLAWLTEENVINTWNRERNEVTTAQLSGIQASWPLKWLTDGKRLVFAGYDGGSWFVVNADGTELVEYKEP